MKMFVKPYFENEKEITKHNWNQWKQGTPFHSQNQNINFKRTKMSVPRCPLEGATLRLRYTFKLRDETTKASKIKD